MAKTGEKTWESRLDTPHERKLESEKGPKSPQKMMPVTVMDTVKIYLKKYSLSFHSLRIFGKSAMTSKTLPIQIFDCAVKYKSRADQ